MLPEDVTVVGIDEHTALTVDVAAGQRQVLGQGRVTVVRGDREQAFADGASFALNDLGPFHPADLLSRLPDSGDPRGPGSPFIRRN